MRRLWCRACTWLLVILAVWSEGQAATLPFQITGLSCANGLAVVRWSGPTNLLYQIQHRTNLTAAWQNLGATTDGFAATNSLSGPCGFFRVMALTNSGATADLSVVLNSPVDGSTVSNTVTLVASATGASR